MTKCHLLCHAISILLCCVVGCDADPTPWHENRALAKPLQAKPLQAKPLQAKPLQAKPLQAKPPDPVRAPGPAFFGTPDEPLRQILAGSKIEKASQGRGGRSLAFKLRFEGGVQGYFKPEQTFAANWYSELASYYLDRELELGRVPPAVGRRIEWDRLRVHAANDPRLREAVVRDGLVRGAVVWWVPEQPAPLELPEGWESWLRIETAHHPSPFQRPPDYFKQRRRGSNAPLSKPVTQEVGVRAAELSDLIVFDHLIGNLDRWGGNLTNVRTFGEGKRLIYLDNANGFEPRKQPSQILQARLTFVQRFRRATVRAVRTLDLKALQRRMAADPLAPLLTDVQLEELDARRRQVLAHVDDLEEKFGARALPW